MVLNRISNKIDGKLIRQHNGFRAGKSCTGQILNLVKKIKNGYEIKMITGVNILLTIYVLNIIQSIVGCC